MKRCIVFLLAAVLVFSFAACEERETTKPSETKIPAQNGSDSSDEKNVPVSEGGDTAGSRILIAYFSVPEDVSTDGVDAVSGASIVVKDGQKLGNTEYVAKLIQQLTCEKPSS